jgi:uncharacterized protein
VTISPAALENVTEAADIPAQLVDVMQPLDYAPRKTPDEQGQLSETFGLEKTHEESLVLGETKKAG